jgi:glycosyltransferase involved in cell wall biosynthesis
VPVPSAWSFKVPENSKFISAFVCESNTIPVNDREKLKNVSQIWSPSIFCQKVLKNNGFESKLIPYSMEMPQREAKRNQNSFTFLCSFDGKFTIHRKGILFAIEAFKKAFTDIDDVNMLIKTFDLNQDSKDTLLKHIENDSRISISDKFVKTVDEIYDNIDCYVSLHTSEGFGRHLAEAMLRKIPVIATNYGGSTDFCNKLTAAVVGGEFIKHNYDPQYYWDGVWLKPDIDEAVLAMKQVYQGNNINVDVGEQIVQGLYNDNAVSVTMMTHFL